MSHEEYENLAALEAVGAASPDEQAALLRHLEECDGCERMMAEMRNAAALLAQGLEPVPPPPAVRERVLNAIGAKPSRPAATHVTSRFSRWLLPAAAAVAFVLLAWSQMLLLGQRERVEQAEARAQIVEEQAKRLSEERQLLESENARLESLMASLSAASTRTISLGGQPMAPAASARVFLNTRDRQAFVFFHDLPANPEDKSYQLWMIPAEGDPMGVGVFDVDARGSASMVLQNLPVGREIKALAVTMEPKGGMPSPTGEMYLMGGMS
jgi:anti-sigma-K factor RskA